MKCTTGLPHPCGQCLACLINARRIWVGRLMLEAQCHEHSFFSTFTYEEVPRGGTLVKDHISSTFHRLRKLASGRSKAVRFFAVGEYGDQLSRPHYHAAVFGLSAQESDLITRAWYGLRDPEYGARPGFCYHGSLTPDSASYIAGYVTKKLTNKNDPAVIARLAGREPEFAVMSRRPGIGMLRFEAFAEALSTRAGALYIARFGDVPVAFSVGGRTLPVGRVMRDHLRLFLFGATGTPARAKELRERNFYRELLPFLPDDASPTLRRLAAQGLPDEISAKRKEYFETLGQRKLQMDIRHQIANSRRKL